MRDFTLSHFLRHSGDVLEVAASQDTVLRRRDADDLVLTTVDRQRALLDGLDLLGRVVAAMSAGPQHEVVDAELASCVGWTNVLSRSERHQLLGEVAAAAAAAGDLGTPEPLQRALDRWRLAARVHAARPVVSAHLTRPVAIPDDVDDPSIEKANGAVELPLHVRWSYPRRTYDLTDVRQLRRVYEQVLREGTDEDVRYFIDVGALIANWDALVLPPRVRQAWADWLRRRRGADLAC